MNIIYNDNILLTTQINEGAIERYELMKEHYVMLPFSLENPVYFPLGSYAIIDNVRFELCDLYKPDFNINTGGYDYKLRLDIYYWKWKNKIFKYLPTENSGGETEWSLTAPLAVFLEVFCRNLAKLGYTYNSQAYTFSIDNTATTASKNIVFSSANMIDALNQMADTFGCEWWVTDNIIHFGRNENGTYTDFQIGVNVETMSRSESKTTYATRVIAFGSTRNIPSNYRENSQDVTVEGVVQKRLMLPVSQCPSGYVDAVAGQTQEESVETVLILDDIYPKVECVVGEVSPYQASVEEEGQTVTKTFYRVDDTSGFLDNFTEEMILEGETLRILFESGLLQGMEFDCQLILDDSLLGKCFEVVVNEDYGRELPDDILFPQSGDKYVISGWDATKIAATGIIDKAEQELYQETLAYINKTKIDPNTYECSLMSDYAQEHEFAIGAKIRLLNAAYFQDGRYSRVIGYEKKLDIPYDTPKYFVGETPSVSRLGNLEAEVKSLMYGGSEYGYAGGSAYYLITSNDTTKATDDNVYSALASEKRFLRKDVQDTAKEKTTFNKGLQIGPNFVPGIAGGVGGLIDKDANAELRSLVLRSFLQVPELRYNRVLVELGDKWNAPGAGIIEEVTIDDGGTTGTCKLKLEEGEYGAIAVGDICMGIFHSESTPSMNATADSDDGKGNFQFAGFYTCYFRITSVSNAEGKVNNQYFTYALRPTDGSGGSWNKAWHPSEAMHFVVYGSFTDTSRQTSVYTTRTYTRMLAHQNTWEFSASNIGLQYGDMSNLSIFGIDMSGYSIYLNNVYFTGTIRQVDPQGQTIMTANDRGAYVAGTTYAYYDRVSTDKGLWLCVNENGTNTAPSESNSDWLLQVPAGESLNPEGAWDITKVPYAYNSVVTYADRVWVANKETSDVPYDTVHDTQSPDWDLLIDISGITDGEDGASLEVQYSADGTNWHSTFANTDIYMRQRVGDGAWSGAIRVVGEAGQDGDYKDFQFAKNTSTTTAPTSGWQDAPPSVSNGEYLWMRVRWVYGDGRQPSAWSATRIKGDKGNDGESSLFLDFDNEYIQVACVSGTSYKADGAQTKYTGLTLFYGTHSCALTSILINGSTSYSQNGITITTDYSTSTITFAISDQAIVSERTFEFSVTGTYDGNTYVQSGKVKLRGVPAAADGSPAVLYELEPSVNVIAKYKDDTLSINSISCKVIKFVGSNRSETAEKTLRYQIDGGSITTISNRSTWSQATSAITQHITFYLYDGNVLIDKERVPLVTDGKDGDGFSLAGAWSSTHGVYAKMSVVSMGGASFVAMNDTSNPPMWCYKLSDGSYAKLSDGGYALTGDVNTTDWEMLSAAPNAPLDSISDEFIFKNSTTKPAKPTSQNTDDYVPTGWTDDPVGVSISFPTEWVCKRTRRNGVWGEYSDPAVFAQFGKDGGFKSRVFLRNNTQPETPTGGTYDSPIPNGWSDGIPSGTAILWSSVCTFNADGTSSGWSTPAAETDTDTLDIEFSPSTTEPSAPSGSTPYADHESEGWYDPNSPNFAGKDYIWRAERKVSNGVYDGAWTITRIKGEKGDSNVIADLDNEVQSIACDSTGKATAAYTLTTNVGMWYGTQELTLSSITNTTATNVTITPNASQKKVTFAIAKNAVIAEVNNITLTLKAVHNAVTYTRTLVFTLNGVRGGADGTPATIYELVPSVSSVKKDKNGNLSVSSISCTRQKIVGSTITNNTIDGAFTYSVNGGNEQSYTNNQSITIQTTTTRVQFYLRIDSVLVDTETIHVIADGEDGESVIFADIDNEVQSIACTSEGKATKAYTLTTTVSMWYGLTELTISNVTWNTISGITVSRSGKILTFRIANAATIAEVNKFSLSVSATHNGKTYSKSLVFTINGVRGGADGTPATIYSLVPSATSIKRDKEGSHSPSVIYCTRQKTVGSQITNNTTDGTITYSVNNGSEQSYTNNTNITVTSSMKTVAFFFRIGSTLVDKETLHVIEDGKDGEGYNHRGDWVSGMTLAKNDVVNMGGGTYVARHDNVTAAPLSSYLLSNGDRILLSDGGYALNGQLNLTDYWVMVARPEDGKDGKDFEFIFKLTETEDTRPSKPTSQNTDGYVPSGWTDDATGISLAYRAEWFCMRKKENGVWGEYTPPVLWSRYAEDGENAVMADLDNEMESISISDKGVTTAPNTFYSNVWFVDGNKRVTPTSVAFSGQPSGVTCSYDSGLVTIAVPTGTQMPSGTDYKANIVLTLTGTVQGVETTRELTFTIKGIVGGVVYQLVPQFSSIRKSGSTLTPSTLNVQVRKVINGVATLAGRGEANVYATIDDGSRNAMTRSASSDYWQIALPSTTKKVFLEVERSSDGVVFDSETIQTIEDGEDGKGVVSAVRWYILCSSNTTLNVGTNTYGSWSKTKPAATSQYKYIWAKDIYTYTDTTTTETAAFCISPEKGDPGRYGAAPRIREYDAIVNLTDSESKYIYRGDEENAEWYDIVVITNPANGSQRKFRLKAISNRPRLITNLPKPTVDDGWATYWQEAESHDFVDIDLLVARVAYLENLVASIVKAREMYLFANVQRSGDPAIEFYVSEDNGVNQGHLVFNQLDSDGNATASYDLSYEGLKNLQSSGTAVPSSWTPMNGFVQPVNSSGTYYTNLYQIWTRFYITSVDSSTHVNGKTYYKYTAAGVRQQDGTVVYNGPDAVHNGKLFKSASANVGNFVADGRYVQFSGEAMIVTTDTDVEVYKGFAITVSSGTMTGKVAFYYNSDGHKMVQNESGTWQQASSDTISWT